MELRRQRRAREGRQDRGVLLAALRLQGAVALPAGTTLATCRLRSPGVVRAAMAVASGLGDTIAGMAICSAVM